jgi:hypothetical protein
MKRFAVALCAALLAASLNIVHAADLDRSDPDRAQILAAAHRSQNENGRFVVLDMVKDGDAAFLCAAIRLPEGGIEKTDDTIDIDLLAFRKTAGGWKAVAGAAVGSGSPLDRTVCAPGGHVIKTHADINAFVKLANPL